MLRKNLSPNFLLIVILLTASLLRLNHVAQPFIDTSGWRETSTAMMAKNFYENRLNIFYPQVDWGGPGPNYQGREFQTLTFFVAILYKVFGFHEWLGRLVVIFFGLWGIFCLYKLISRVWDEEKALVGAAVMAVLPGSVFLERSFLPDPVMASLLINALWLLAIYCQEQRRLYYLLAIVIGCVGVLTKINGLIMVIPAAYLVYKYLGAYFFEKKRLWFHFLPICCALFFIAGYYLWATYLATTGSTKHFAGSNKFLTSVDTLSKWIQNKYFLHELYNHLKTWMWTLPVLFLVIVGLLVFRSNKKTGAWFFHFWALGLAAQYLIEAQHLETDPWNMQLYNPFAAAFSGYAIVAISRFVKDRVAAFSVPVFIVLVIGFLGIFGYNKSKWRYESIYQPDLEIARQFEKVAAPNELMITLGTNPIPIYYGDTKGWVFPPAKVWDSGYTLDHAENDIKLMESLKDLGAKWIVISYRNNYLKGIKKQQMLKMFPKVSEFLFLRNQVIVENKYGIIVKLTDK